MAFLDDFVDNTLVFLTQNVVFVGVPNATSGVVNLSVAAPANPAVAGNLPQGVANGCVSGGVYMLRLQTPADARALPAYFCPYSPGRVEVTTLGNGALWAFTADMDGCTFGVGHQGPHAGGHVTVLHANMMHMQGSTLTPGGGAPVTGIPAQRRLQKMLAVSHIGPNGELIEPEDYLGAPDARMHATTFGHHANGGPWTFQSLTYRNTGGGQFIHGGLTAFHAP